MQAAVAHDSGVLHVGPAGDYEDAARRKQMRDMRSASEAGLAPFWDQYAAGMPYAGGVKFLQLSVLLYARNDFLHRKSRFHWPKETSFQSPINFVRIAYRTNSAVDETLSLRIADARWVSTVFTLRFKIAPTDLLVCPSAIN